MNFIIIALPALFICLIMKCVYKHEISTKECFLQFGAAIISIIILYGATYASMFVSMSDTEILNGEVLSKKREVEICGEGSSCKHYTVHQQCTQSTDSKGNSTESCIYYKIYDYAYEVDWTVQTSVDSHTIERVNRQGTMMPDRWKIINIGDPASTSSFYLNYLLGNKDSLFYQEQYEKDFTEQYKKSLPDYPKIYDYYRINHVINLTSHSSKGYNEYINSVLRSMGKAKQVNLVLVMYNSSDANFVKAVLGKWRGGKKNDVIMFFGLNNEGTVSKFDSTSFGQGMRNELLHSTLRMDALTEPMSIELVQKLVKDVNDHFSRLPNKEFEYMKYKLEPSMWIVLICSILAAAASIGVGIYMRKVNL